MSDPSAPGQDAEFDAILSVPAATSAPLSEVTPPPMSSAHAPAPAHELHGEPTLAEFRDNWDLYQDAVCAGVAAGAVLGLLGVFVVLRRAVFVTAAVSQAAGLGVAVAFFLSIHVGLELPPVSVAFAFGVGAALLIGAFRRAPREAVVGFVYLAASAGAVIVGAHITQEAHDISAILFGTAVLVRPDDLALVLGVGAVATAVVLVARRGLVFAGLDPETARVQGLPVRGLEMLLAFLVAAEVSVTTRALGALPVFAFAVLPAVAALGLARRFPGALTTAALIGGLSGGLGYVAAFMFELPVGASQAMLAALGCALTLLIARVRRAMGA
jgi:zinc transport system permease protein